MLDREVNFSLKDYKSVFKERFPVTAPKTAPDRDKIHPLPMNIHRDVIQKFGSTRADMIPPILQRMGTYHMLFGSFLQMKKHAMVMIIL